MRQQYGVFVAVAVSLGAAVLAGVAVWLALQTRLAHSDISPSEQQFKIAQELPKPASNETSELQQQIEALEVKVMQLSASVAAQPSTLVKSNSKPAVSNQVKEYFVYLGTGSSTSRDWSDINGTLATIDMNQYGAVKSVTFEATLSIISGEVYARLKNASTGAVYYPSQVIHNTSTSQWRTSQTFSLPSGANQYVVQLRSSNGEKAQLDGSRIKIVVE